MSQTWFCLFVPSCPEHWPYSMAWSVSPALARVHLLVAHTESFAGEEGTVWRDRHSDRGGQAAGAWCCADLSARGFRSCRALRSAVQEDVAGCGSR